MEKAYQEEDLRIRIKFLIIRTIITSLSVLIALAKIILVSNITIYKLYFLEWT